MQQTRLHPEGGKRKSRRRRTKKKGTKKRNQKKGIKKQEYRKKNIIKKSKTRKIIKMNGGYTFKDYTSEKEIHDEFKKSGIKFQGKRCLDIGTRNGLNCITLVDFGAEEVVGIDIDDSRFNEMYEEIKNEEEYLSKITLKKQDLLEMNAAEKFDIITCFLWNMSVVKYDEIMEKIKSLLNDDGIVYIGIHDDVYKYDEYGASVLYLLQKYFHNVRILVRPSWQWILEAHTKKEAES
jgi:2-polyprenyl-3-methyl-5-hydroxy-6-metoxy-1,4-benzoquinol methylase